MRFPVVSLIMVFALLICALPRAWSEIDAEAQRVFDRYAEAIGGEEAYSKVDTARMGMLVEMPNLGMRMQVVATLKRPDRVHVRVDLPGMGAQMQGYDGVTGWAIDPVQGSREIRGAELEKLKSEYSIDQGLKLAEKYSAATVDGSSDEGWAIVKAISKEGGHEDRLYFDRETGLMRKSETMEDLGPQGEVPAITHVRDYARYGELLIPAILEVKAMGIDMRMTLETFERNVEVDDRLFQMPE